MCDADCRLQHFDAYDDLASIAERLVHVALPFFEHVEVYAEDHGNCFGLQLMHDLIKYANADAVLRGGSAVAFLWSSPHQYNGQDGLRKHDVFGMRFCQSTR